jgi:hypothetical protein
MAHGRECSRDPSELLLLVYFKACIVYTMPASSWTECLLLIRSVIGHSVVVCNRQADGLTVLLGTGFHLKTAPVPLHRTNMR